jgi:hypothetical protein
MTTQRHLATLVDQMNRWASVFKDPTIDLVKLSQTDADRIFQKIDGGMSPENLACDGEASLTHIRRTRSMYEGSVKELRKRGFTPSGRTYEIPQAWLK